MGGRGEGTSSRRGLWTRRRASPVGAPRGSETPRMQPTCSGTRGRNRRTCSCVCTSSALSVHPLTQQPFSYSFTTHSLAAALLSFKCAGACRRARLWPPVDVGRMVNELEDPATGKIVLKEKKHRSEKLQSYGPAPHLPSSKSSSEFEDILALFVSCASRPACVERKWLPAAGGCWACSLRLWRTLHGYQPK